jgi:hypothetical protein
MRNKKIDSHDNPVYKVDPSDKAQTSTGGHTMEEQAKREILTLMKSRQSRGYSQLVTLCQVVADLHPEELTVDEVFHLCLELRNESKMSFSMASDGELTVY